MWASAPASLCLWEMTVSRTVRVLFVPFVCSVPMAKNAGSAAGAQAATRMLSRNIAASVSATVSASAASESSARCNAVKATPTRGGSRSRHGSAGEATAAPFRAAAGEIVRLVASASVSVALLFASAAVGPRVSMAAPTDAMTSATTGKTKGKRKASCGGAEEGTARERPVYVRGVKFERFVCASLSSIVQLLRVCGTAAGGQIRWRTGRRTAEELRSQVARLDTGRLRWQRVAGRWLSSWRAARGAAGAWAGRPVEAGQRRRRSHRLPQLLPRLLLSLRLGLTQRATPTMTTTVI
jgi:hypothetical protein